MQRTILAVHHPMKVKPEKSRILSLRDALNDWQVDRNQRKALAREINRLRTWEKWDLYGDSRDESIPRGYAYHEVNQFISGVVFAIEEGIGRD